MLSTNVKPNAAKRMSPALVARVLPRVVERRAAAPPAGIADDDRNAEREELDQQQQKRREAGQHAAAGHIGDLRNEHPDQPGQQRQHDDRRVAGEHAEGSQVDQHVRTFARGSHGAVSARPGEPNRTNRSVRSGSVSMSLKMPCFTRSLLLCEHFDHLDVRDRLDAVLPFEADVVVGDQRDVDVAHLELAREIRLRVVGHVDDLPAQTREPLRLRSRREARPLDDDDRTGIVGVDLEVAQRFDRHRPHLRAVRIGEADVRGDRAVVERVLAAGRAIDDLIGDDHRSRLDVRLQRAARGRPDDARDAELFERPGVGAVVDRLRRIAVIFSVARQKRDLAARDLAQRDFVRGRAVRRLDPNLLRVVEQAIKARSAVYADLGRVRIYSMKSEGLSSSMNFLNLWVS